MRMAAAGVNSTDGSTTNSGGLPPEALLYMQNKLERIYKRTFKFLTPWKSWMEEACLVLVWNKPLASAALYIAVHWAFVVFAQSEYSWLTRLGNLLFWCVAADVLWRAATNQFGGEKDRGDRGSSSSSSSSRRGFFRAKHSSSSKRIVSFDTALTHRSIPLKAQELPKFEVVCLWVAEDLMWVDNLFIALRHWSVHEPYLFFASLFLPGVFLSLLGKYIPTLVVIYIIVMLLLVWPYVEYHDLRRKLMMYIETHYPKVLQQAKATWLKIKTFVSKDTAEFPEVSLVSGGQGGEAATEQAFQDALEGVTGTSTPISNAPRSGGSGSGGQVPHPSSQAQSQPAAAATLPRRAGTAPAGGVSSASDGGGGRGDPGMSLLQDSVLGLHPNAFRGPDDSLSYDSLALGPGSMPSLSDLDHSLSLPQFPQASRGLPTGGQLEQSISLPQFPMGQGGRGSGSGGSELEESISLPQFPGHSQGNMRSNSYDLDPLLDSMDFTDGNRPRPHPSQRPHPLTQPARPMSQIIEEPLDMVQDAGWAGQTGFDAGYVTSESSRDYTTYSGESHTLGHVTGEGVAGYGAGGFVAPPTYQAALDGSDGAVSSERSSNQTDKTGGGGTNIGGYLLRQRHH